MKISLNRRAEKTIKKPKIYPMGCADSSFAKAAEMAKLSLWEFADLIKKRNVEWVGLAPEEVEKELGKRQQPNAGKNIGKYRETVRAKFLQIT